eukprot:g9237.t1
MALPEHKQQYKQQQQHGEELSTSCRKNNSTPNKRHSSAPPQHQRTTTCTVPDARQTLMFHPHEDHFGSAAATPSASTTTHTPTAVVDTDDPLSFPTPKFSVALKVVEDDTVTLVSQATGRRWMAINSSRECQFGEVLRAVELTGEAAAQPAYFAIKELSLERLREMQGRTHEDPLREVAALQYLSGEGHPNVLTCTEALHDKDNLYIVTPFYSGGEVFDALIARGRFEEDEARPLFRQALEALVYLKKHGVCHRDVSLENLMLAEGNVVKLVDFGLALRIPQTDGGAARTLPPQGVCGKQYYMSPEVLASSSEFDGFAVDVWACGVMLFVMLTGVPPFELALPSQDQRCQIVAVEERLAKLLSAWGLSLSSEATGLIQSCLLFAPERRPSLETLRNHPWIDA